MLRNLVNYFLLVTNNEKGQGMVEYALIIALIAIVAIAVFTSIGDGIVAQLQKIVDELPTP